VNLREAAEVLGRELRLHCRRDRRVFDERLGMGTILVSIVGGMADHGSEKCAGDETGDGKSCFHEVSFKAVQPERGQSAPWHRCRDRSVGSERLRP
jgi:hypothetical protein